MTTAEAIRARIEEIPVGTVFTTAQFTAMGTRASIHQTLSRLVRQGHLTRVARGVFVRPKQSRYVGQVMPEPSHIAQAIAEIHGETIQVHGAEAARRMGLSTQMPLQPIFYTNGPTRKLKIGKLQLVLKHTTPRKLALAGRPSGLALTALWYIGKEHISPEVIHKVQAQLSPESFQELAAETKSMPAWMADAVHHYQRREHRV